jgi:ferritin-like metal-binding protein YciE
MSTTFRECYVDELRDIYDAEKQMLQALPKLAEAAHSPQLKTAFNHHLGQTETQVQRLEQIFEELHEKPTGNRCEAMTGLIQEARQLMRDVEDPDVLDAALIAAAQKVEHYEIASYGTVATYAKMLGDMEVAKILGQILSEEKHTDQKLTQLAESHINVEATEGSAD